jgi:hypothetical protein
MIWKIGAKEPHRTNNWTLRNSRELINFLLAPYMREISTQSSSPYIVISASLSAPWAMAPAARECTGLDRDSLWPRSEMLSLWVGGQLIYRSTSPIDNYIMRAAVLSCLLFGHLSDGARPLLAHQLDNGACSLCRSHVCKIHRAP